MQTYRPSDRELSTLRIAAAKLKEAYRTAAEQEKIIEANKAHLAEWLKDNRGVNLDALEIGELIQIENVVQIEIGSQARLDAKALLAQAPTIYEAFSKPIPVKKFKPLV
jgi:hypothetical protein